MTLAVAYQLMSGQTNCILVHQRADAERATEPAELHHVSSMLAAGWGATSTAKAPTRTSYAAICPPSLMCLVDTDVDGHCPEIPGDFEIADSWRSHTRKQEPESLRAIALAVVEHQVHVGQEQGLAACCEALALHPEARVALAQAVAQGASDEQAWLLLAHWTNVRTNGLASAVIAATLQPYLDALDGRLIDDCMKLFDRILGGYAIDGWEPLRSRRLRRALTRDLS